MKPVVFRPGNLEGIVRNELIVYALKAKKVEFKVAESPAEEMRVRDGRQCYAGFANVLLYVLDLPGTIPQGYKCKAVQGWIAEADNWKKVKERTKRGVYNHLLSGCPNCKLGDYEFAENTRALANEFPDLVQAYLKKKDTK